MVRKTIAEAAGGLARLGCCLTAGGLVYLICYATLSRSGAPPWVGAALAFGTVCFAAGRLMP